MALYTGSICEENAHADVQFIIKELRNSLYSFDLRWVTFEQVEEDVRE